MIAKKVFTADGVNTRFLSDFIIQSEQFTRVYAYIYDNTLNPNGSEDGLQNPSLPWNFPSNLYKRGFNAPNSGEDLLTIDKWDLVTNSILTYEVPLAPTKIWIEVATTAEEFGDTLTQPSVERAETAAANAEASEVAALASETAAALSETAAALSETNASASETAAAASEVAALASETAAALSETAAALSETNAAASETAAALSETAAALSETNAAASETAAALSETNAATSEVNSATSAAAAALAVSQATKVDGRNTVISSPNGVLAEDVTPTPSHIDVIYTGNGTSQDIVTGLPSESRPWVASASYTAGQYRTHLYVIYQALTTHSGIATTPDADATNWVAIADGVHLLADNADVWIKARAGTSVVRDHRRVDTLRGTEAPLYTNLTTAEGGADDGLTSFNLDGFTIGSHVAYNENLATYVAWCEYFDTMFSFTTNHGKRGICAYNAQSGKFMVSYQGSGTAGHEIPHGVETKPDFLAGKSRDSVLNWPTYTSAVGATEVQQLNLNNASTVGTYWDSTEPTDTVFTIGTSTVNVLNNNYIMYGSSNRDNHSKVVPYTGTGAAGNEVDVGMDLAALDTAGKKIKIEFKSLSAAGSWGIVDVTRGITQSLYADLSNVEDTGTTVSSLTSNGFIVSGTATWANIAGVLYLATVTIEDYDKPNGGLTVNANNTVTYAEGTDETSGDLDTIETLTGGVVSLTAGTTNYIYADKGDVLGATTVKLLEGMDRVSADKWGVVSPSDATLKTTDKHSDYASGTGVVSSDTATAGYEVHNAFDKTFAGNQFATLSSKSAEIIYELSEERELHSWRFAQAAAATALVDNVEVLVSDDGVTFSTFTASQAVATGVSEWSALFTGTPVNCKYIKINLSGTGGATNIGVSEIELNTEHLAGDFYNVPEGKMYNSSDVAQSRTYLGQVVVDGSGEIIPDTIQSYTVGRKQVTDLVVHNDAVFHGDVSGKNICTAWVNFDGTTTPPTMFDSYNVSDVVRTATGVYDIYFEIPMDNINYSIAAGNTAWVAKCVDGQIYLNKVTIYSYNASVALLNRACFVQIFGGR